MTCKDIMTDDPRCCVPEDSVIRAAEIMRDEDVGPVPVINDPSTRKVVGIITDRDIAIDVVAEGRDAKSSKVGDIMSTDLVTCYEDDDIEEALEAMTEHQVRRIPVVREDGTLAGIISQADIALQTSEEETGEMVEGISEPGGLRGMLRSRSSSRGQYRGSEYRETSGGGFGANSLLMGAVCLSIGAGIMYLLDTGSGQTRRTRIRDKASDMYENIRGTMRRGSQEHGDVERESVVPTQF